MRLSVVSFLGLVGFAAAVVRPELGYHQKVGIPLAAQLKVQEERIITEREKDNRIVGGAISPTTAHPYLAGLLISFVNIAGQSACGSTLLSANRLVTAAHCWFDGFNQASQYLVVLGSNMLHFGGIRIATNTVVTHPQYSPYLLLNDIAMIYLPTSVALNARIQPAALPTGSAMWETFAGQWTLASGFGKTSDAQFGASTVLSQVNLLVITVAQCQAVFGFYATSSNICTSGAGGVGICQGDSGGPLILNRNGQQILIGVSSYVANLGCQLGYPSAFARITSFLPFIQQHLF